MQHQSREGDKWVEDDVVSRTKEREGQDGWMEFYLHDNSPHLVNSLGFSQRTYVLIL